MDIDLDALEARAKAATPGPWTSSPQLGQPGHCDMAQVWDAAGSSLACIEPSDTASENATHIAGLAPQTVLALVEEIKGMRRIVDAEHRARDMTAGQWKIVADQETARAAAAETETTRLRAVVEKLAKALETAVCVAGEAADEWDRAPSGMKAGKLLIALSDRKLRYRGDINEMHEARHER